MMIDGKHKAIIQLASLATVYLLSAKLAFACRAVNYAVIEEGIQATNQFYFALSFAAFIAVCFIYLMRKRRGLIVVGASFFIMTLHLGLKFSEVTADCGTLYIESASCLGGLSFLCLLYQTAIYVKER